MKQGHEMNDPSKSYQKLIEENSEPKHIIKELEQSEAEYKRAEKTLRASEFIDQTMFETCRNQ
jgi:hypothetical protein